MIITLFQAVRDSFIGDVGLGEYEDHHTEFLAIKNPVKPGF